MQVNIARALALFAVALALVVATAGARQQGNASPQSQEATSPSPPVKVKAGPADKGDAAPMSHHHGASAETKSQDVKGKYMTIVGEVMDPACFLEAGTKSIGPGHYQCAIDCARSGQTLAIYARDQDQIYFVAGELPGKNPNDPLMPYIHKKVDVTGTVYHRSGAYGIVITKVVPHEEKSSVQSLRPTRVEVQTSKPTPAGGETKDTQSPPATGAPAGK